MKIISNILVGFVAIQHIVFMYLEMYLWNKPAGRKIFGTTVEAAASSKTLAGNQGLYNGFLAAGLIWGLLHPQWEIGAQIQLFFLICVLIAGIYAGVTVKKSIMAVQGLPALITLIIYWVYNFIG